MKSEELEKLCRRLRRMIVDMVQQAGSGHLGGSLSIVEILVALYYKVMDFDPGRIQDPDRDHLILSKGHGCPALYAVLIELGVIPAAEAGRFRRFGGMLKGHPDMLETPGIDFSTGSLGQGLSAGAGLALAARLDRRGNTIFVILGDGELDEGQCWEAMAFAAHHRLDNLVAIIDRNRLQLDGFTSDIVELDPLPDKLRAFGWSVREVDGHDPEQVAQVLLDGKRSRGGRPVAVVAHTVKGKGVAGLENTVESHSRLLTPEEYAAFCERYGGGWEDGPVH